MQQAHPKITLITERLNAARRSKLDPVEDEYAFRMVYPVLSSLRDATPFALIVSESESVRERIISHVFRTEVEYHRGVRLFAGSTAEANESGKHLAGVQMFERLSQDELSSIAVRNIPTSEILQEVAIVEGLANQIPELLPGSAESLYIAISVTSPDLGRDFRAFLSRTKSLHNRMRLIIFDADHSPLQLSQVIWTLAKCFHTVELPLTYFMDGKAMVDRDLFTDLQRIPARMALTRILSARSEARLARAHAYLMSHIKSLLPIFNRQAKQDKVADDITEIISTVARKHMIPVTDFPSADYIRESIRSFDFSKLKKMKESSLSLLNEFIDHDLVQLLAQIPHDITDEQLIEVSTSAVGALAKSSETLRAPDISAYRTAFESMGPNQDGVLIGSESLRNHLLSISKLSSSSLYRIWRLSDHDRDGGLNLKEYAICRELIKLVSSGGEIPKELPPSFLGI